MSIRLFSQGSAAASVLQLNDTSDAIIPVDNADSFIIGSDRFDRDPAAASKNIRFFFHKTKGAFRAGTGGSGARWDSANVGDFSVALGESCQAFGRASFASGTGCIADGDYAFAEGTTTNASGNQSHAEGNTTTASGSVSHAEGNSTTAAGTYSHAEGSHAHATRYAQHAKAGGTFGSPGDAQVIGFTAFRSTTDATASTLFFDGSSAAVLSGSSNTNVLTLVARRAFTVTIRAVARRNGADGEMAGWTWTGLVGRDSTGNARIIGTPVTQTWADTPAAGWTLAVSINTTDATYNYLQLTATGEAAKTIRWVASIEATEVGA